MRLKNKQKNRVRTPNHHTLVIFCAFFGELILRKSPKICGLKISKKVAPGPQITAVGWFFVGESPCKDDFRTPNHHTLMIFCAFFGELILRKSPNVCGLKISKKSAFAPPITTVGWFVLGESPRKDDFRTPNHHTLMVLCSFFLNLFWENHLTYEALK